jgi:hypothetical protein
MALTNIGCEKAKAKDKDYKLYDEKGLYLLVKNTGAKYWRMDGTLPASRARRQPVLDSHATRAGSDGYVYVVNTQLHPNFAYHRDTSSLS